MCEHCAPVEDKIVVSEIGEQWSPNTDDYRLEYSNKFVAGIGAEAIKTLLEECELADMSAEIKEEHVDPADSEAEKPGRSPEQR